MKVIQVEPDGLPFPIWLCAHGEEGAPRKPPTGVSDLLDHDPRLWECEFRGVSIDRLATVLSTGIDVEPPDGVIWANDFEKAWEYGDFPKVILALNQRLLDRTYRQVPTDTSQAELDELRVVFPTVVRDDGPYLWLSRLEESDPRVGSPYEADSAWWIPGDPFTALIGVFLFVHEEKVPGLLAQIEATD